MYNLADNVKMDAGFSSYHNGGPAREQDFGKLSQTIGTSILKISQNGEWSEPINSLDSRVLYYEILTLMICFVIAVSSMQKMVNQLGSSTDSQELRNQL